MRISENVICSSWFRDTWHSEAEIKVCVTIQIIGRSSALKRISQNQTSTHDCIVETQPIGYSERQLN